MQLAVDNYHLLMLVHDKYLYRLEVCHDLRLYLSCLCSENSITILFYWGCGVKCSYWFIKHHDRSSVIPLTWYVTTTIKSKHYNAIKPYHSSPYLRCLRFNFRENPHQPPRYISDHKNMTVSGKMSFNYYAKIYQDRVYTWVTIRN